MFYIACFIFGFTILQLLVVLANVIFEPKLPKGHLKENILISVLIPARNEEDNIGNVLNDLITQDYRNIEVIIFNDQSTDQTTEIVRKYISLDSRIHLIESTGLPAGWLGKNYACHSLSEYAKGEYFLFIDADVRMSGDIIMSAVAYAKRYQLSLLSIFPQQIIKSMGEKATVPNMNYILLSLLPLILVRKSKKPSFAAANGQFMLLSAEIYKSLTPHKKMRDNKVEDIAIARYFKENQLNVACLVGNETIKCRMYTNFNDAVKGFSKNVVAFFGNSFAMAVLFWITITFGFVAIFLAFPVSIFLFYIFIYLFIRFFISRISHQSMFDNLFFLIPQLLSCGLFIYNAFLNKFIKEYEWKGRSIH